MRRSISDTGFIKLTSTEENNGSQDWVQFDEALCERYLFGELTEPEQERFEEAYFDDDVFFDRFTALKTELLDLYSRGQLDPEKHARMEPHFLATAPRRQRLAESSQFVSAVNATSDRGNPAVVVVPPTEPSFFESLVGFFTVPRLAGAAALLIAAIGGIYLLNRAEQDGATDVEFAQQPPRPTETPAIDPRPSSSPNNATQPSEPEVTVNPPDSTTTTPRTSPSPKSEVAARPKSRRPTPAPPDETRRDPDQKYVASDSRDRSDKAVEFTIPQPSITLRAGATRDIGESKTLTIPAGARSASITLLFRSGGYTRYIVTITTVDGAEVFRRVYDKRLIRDGNDGSKRLTVLLQKASDLGEKDYIVKLEGYFPGRPAATIEEYYFHVRRAKVEPTKKP